MFMHYFFIINLVSTLHNCLTKMVEVRKFSNLSKIYSMFAHFCT